MGLIITRLPQTRPALIAKSEEAMRERIAALDSELAHIIIADHAITSVAEAIGKPEGVLLQPAGKRIRRVPLRDRGGHSRLGVIQAGGEEQDGTRGLRLSSQEAGARRAALERRGDKGHRRALSRGAAPHG